MKEGDMTHYFLSWTGQHMFCTYPLPLLVKEVKKWIYFKCELLFVRFEHLATLNGQNCLYKT